MPGAPVVLELSDGHPGPALEERDRLHHPCFLPARPPPRLARRGRVTRTDRPIALLEIQEVAPRSNGAHGLEAVLDHVAVQLHAIAVGVGEIHAPRHVVLDRGLDRHADRLQLLVGRLQLLEAPELPGHVVQARLEGIGRLAGGELEERQVVVLLAEAEEHGPPLHVLVGDLQTEGPSVKVPRLAGVTNFQHDVTELTCLNHGSLLLPKAPALLTPPWLHDHNTITQIELGLTQQMSMATL